MKADTLRGREFFEKNYWTFLRVRDAYAGAPQPAIRWWSDPQALNDTDRAILGAIQGCDRVLDLGAGDLTAKRKMRGGGFAGQYETLDPTTEFAHDYGSLDEVPTGVFDAVMMLEVIEHIPLADFFGFVERVVALLKPDGKLIISTPNAEYLSTIWASDMTHVHAYRAADLAAFLHCHGFESMIRRVAWRSPNDRLKERIRFQVARVVTRGVLQADYARGVLVVSRRVTAPRVPGPARQR
ncbi:MAG: methyltransferase domain-containing protein [Actinomycetota bacterium]